MQISKYKKPGTAEPAYWIDGVVHGDGQLKEMIKLRVDTGADLTCIPSELCERLQLSKTSRKFKLRFGDGRTEVVNSWNAFIEVGGHVYKLDKGVMLANRSDGFLGCDVIDQMDILMSAGIMIIEQHEENSLKEGLL